MANAFSDGVGKGGLYKTEDIKLLVLFVLKTAQTPLTMQSITNVITSSELANYFEVTNAVAKLFGDGLVAFEKPYYSITSKGLLSINELEKRLNVFAIEEAKRNTSKEVIMARRLKENKVDIVTEKNGYTVKISMLEQDKEIMGLNVHVGTLEEANRIKKNFYSDPATVYSQNISFLLGYNSKKDED